MRAYFFTNMYLSSLQQGLQSAHVVGDMYSKYMSMNDDYAWIDKPELRMLHEWSKQHKTIIILNAGYSEAIRDLAGFFEKANTNFTMDVVGEKTIKYPWATFHEGEDALDGALTAVGMILPERIYDTAQEKRETRAEWTKADDDSWMLMYYFGGVRMFGQYQDITEWEKDLIDRISEFGLAK